MIPRKIFASGYLYGLSGGLIGVAVFTLLHIAYFISNSGLDAYLKIWDYPREMVIVGVMISIIPSGVSGVVLAYLLWKEFENGTLSHKKALLKGSLLGIIGVLIV